MSPKSSKTNKGFSRKRLLKLFVANLKKNTLALNDLKNSFETKCHAQENIDKVSELANSVNEKLDVVHKLRNDIKIYRTINTILTNHYIKETRNHENTIDAKIIKLEKQILQSYDNLRNDINSKMANVCVASEKNISAPIQNSNVFMVGNDLKVNQFNDLYVKSQIYNTIIKKIDKLFCGLVSYFNGSCVLKCCIVFW